MCQLLDGVCRDGVPPQWEPIGELIADLIFDCNCPGGALVLCLPLLAASWCVVDGYGSDGLAALVPHALQSVDLPLDLAESHITLSAVQKAFAVVGVSRSLVLGGSHAAHLEAELPISAVPSIGSMSSPHEAGA